MKYFHYFYTKIIFYFRKENNCSTIRFHVLFAPIIFVSMFFSTAFNKLFHGEKSTTVKSWKCFFFVEVQTIVVTDATRSYKMHIINSREVVTRQQKSELFEYHYYALESSVEEEL